MNLTDPAEVEKLLNSESVLKVEFSSPSSASINFQIENSEDETFSIIYHSAFFVIRQFVNLNPELRHFLAHFYDLERLVELKSFSKKMVLEIVGELNGNKIKIVDSDEAGNKKAFVSVLKCSSHNVNHNLKFVGFGFLGMFGNPPMYANLSIEALLVFLLTKFSDDERMVRKILILFYLCAAKAAKGGLTIMNQNMIASGIAISTHFMGEDELANEAN